MSRDRVWRWSKEEMAQGYVEMAALNLEIAGEFFSLEEEAEKIIAGNLQDDLQKNLRKEEKGE
ncbi:MAG: hypothetical protein FWD39_00865 [Clostridiales bacterium]|nr:hypothetical protein [Clostridiales bacterium]